MVQFPNAKINLGLNVVSKRPDGFHNIESVFYPVGWKDVLEILPAAETSFTSSGIAIPGDASGNLCLKAYQAVAKDFALPPVQIHLHKVIPIGAGLGGGSADGAFTIKILNSLFSLGLTEDRMEDYARILGSDCAFFIRNTPVFCYGKGDQFSPVQVDLNPYFIVLVNPQIHIGTAEAYAGIVPTQPATSVQEIILLPVSQWRGRLQNDFEKSVFAKYPAVEAVKEKLYNLGALYASMSGSGSTVYGIFEQELDVRKEFEEGYLVWMG